MQKYLVNTVGMDSRVASSVMTLVLIVYMLMQPAFGALADRIGNKTALIAFGVLAVVCTRPLLMAIGTATGSAAAFVLIVAALTIVSLYSSISGLVKADLFPTELRAMGVGLSFAIANVLFGGTAEYVALWFKSVGGEGSFAWYVTALCAVALGAAISMPNMRTRGYLDGTGTIEPLRQSALK